MFECQQCGNTVWDGDSCPCRSTKEKAEARRSAAACSHSSGVARDLLVVIEQMLGMIPLEEMELRRSLGLHREGNLYCAPEMQDWRAVSATLQTHCEGRSDTWIEAILGVWRNDANANSDGTAQPMPNQQ